MEIRIQPLGHYGGFDEMKALSKELLAPFVLLLFIEVVMRLVR